MSDKIKPQHLQRKAILYVRQSSSYQVTHNEESRRLQYAMRNRLEILGWTEIDVVDDDDSDDPAPSPLPIPPLFATFISRPMYPVHRIRPFTQQKGFTHRNRWTAK